jgi:hydrogenase-4 component E
MNTLAQLVIILLLLNNFALLATGSLKLLIRLIAAQGMLLALLPPLMPASPDFTAGLLYCLAVFAVKGLCLPWLLKRSLRRTGREAHLAPPVGYTLSLLAGIPVLIFSLWLEMRLPLAPGFFPFPLFPAAFGALFAGFVLIAGRRPAMAQVIGYLAVENGIFLLGLPLLSGAGGLWFEMLILLDVLAVVFVMAVAVRHIGDTFESTDVGRFCALKD